MATIWRMQNAQGQGPYWADEPLRYSQIHGRPDDFMSGCDMENHPPPIKEGWDREMVTGKLFGFASEEDAANWFSPSARRYCAERGFHLVKVTGTIVAKGKRQVLFIKG